MTLKNFFLFILSISLFCVVTSYAQGTNKISGIIVDSKLNIPIEYATVVLLNYKDSTQITGITTDSKGSFNFENVKPATAIVRVSFIGFENYYSSKFDITKNSVVDLSTIQINSKSIGTEQIVVSGERAPITYKVDKKVINVSENFSAMSGTATDVLENVPSVTVDLEGNVSLRGSTNFQILIDGRPTIVDPSEALQQIPASAIENIEIITNPSAKYDPEGTSGIINVNLKKNEARGISGILNLNGGLKDKYSTEAVADYKSGIFQMNVGLNFDDRHFTGTENQNNWNMTDTKTSFYSSDGTSNNERESYGVRASLRMDFDTGRNLILGGRYNKKSFIQSSNLNYWECNSLEPDQQYYLSKTNGEKSDNEYQIYGTYEHLFNNNGHGFVLEVDYEAEDGDEVTTNRLFSNNQLVDGKLSGEAGPEKELTTKLDYTLPFDNGQKLEAGYQGEFDYSNERTSLSTYNTSTKTYETNSIFINNAEYEKTEHALYSIFSSKILGLDYKLGFRSEYTGRNIKDPRTSQNYSIDRWDYFPSAHFSYQIDAINQLMVSYTRRINRPRGWELEPFLTWVDAYNIRSGNPTLLPEYINSYELGFQTILGKSVFSIDGYYRITKNKIERVQSVYSENVKLQSIENIGKDFSVGAELFVNFDPVNNWNMNLMGNLYDYRIESISESRESFNWNIRFNNTLKLTGSTQVQINSIYNSPTVSSQGKREGFFSANLAIKQELFSKALTATLQIRDIFKSAKYEFQSEGVDFYNSSNFKREAPVIMLNLRLNFNNFKIDERNDDMNEDSYGNNEEN